MRRFALVLGASVAALSLSACTSTISPLPGLLYTDVKYPSYYDGVEAAGPGSRRGEAQATSILGLIATGDASIEAAAKNGGVQRIHTADTHGMSILGLFATYTTIVTGE